MEVVINRVWLICVDYRLLDKLRHLVTLNEKLKKQESEFRESCKVNISRSD